MRRSGASAIGRQSRKSSDALGYHRYRVSEHHSSASIVGTAPEVLMAAIAAGTRRIRVGSAGVMLPHSSTLKVAEQFRVLEAIAPGRIDLGVGRAPGSDRMTAMALNSDPDAAENFPIQAQELGLWLRGEPLPPGHPFREIRAHPQGPTTPEIWILGSSDYGAARGSVRPRRNRRQYLDPRSGRTTSLLRADRAGDPEWVTGKPTSQDRPN